MLSQKGAHQAASPSAPLQSRGCKRQFQEEDDHTESLKTKRKNPSTQLGSPANEVIIISDDDDEVIILNPTTPPPDRGYGKRSAGNKPHRKKNWF